MTSITATILHNTHSFIQRNHGEATWQEVLHATDSATQQCYGRQWQAKEWVSFEVVDDLLHTIENQLADRDPTVLHRLGLHNAEANLRLTQRVLMRMLTVKMVLKMASLLWNGRIQNGGELQISDGEYKTAVHCLIAGPPHVSDAWWRYLAGWFQRTIELAGGRSVHSEFIGGGSRPYETARFAVHWQ